MGKMTITDFAAKCEWEGGILPAVFEYGLGPDDVEDEHLAGLLRQLRAVEPVVREIEELLEAQEEDA